MYKELAIVAPTASGKTSLSIKLAKKTDAVILSLDSLSVYKTIDISSAKPTLKERNGIVHFGIDIVSPKDNFDVMLFIKEYQKAKQYAKQHGKNLIIVGGTGFYLKSMIDGLSPMPLLNENINQEVKYYLNDLTNAYNILEKLDSVYMAKIKETDKYRIKKALQIYLSTKDTPTNFFLNNKPKPIIDDIKIYQINTPVDILRHRISKRTNIMINNGIIDEVIKLEKQYTREPNCMNAIGIVETLDYLDGKINKAKLEELISIHTAQLAKRQRTFNRSQFTNIIKASVEKLEDIILDLHS